MSDALQRSSEDKEQVMSSSSEDDLSSSTWIPYSERPEWRDVQPVPQIEGDFEVVRIAYTDKFRDVYDYYRAVLVSGEVSERALQLTRDAAELNPANYSVWCTRRKMLKDLNADLKSELTYSRQIIEEHPKNYQVWQHRRALVEWCADPSAELRLTEIILAADPKNYHAWQHRQWVIQTFNLFDDEFAYVERLLDDDVRNNSAWNQRFFVASHAASRAADDGGGSDDGGDGGGDDDDDNDNKGGGTAGSICGALLGRELGFAFDAVKRDAANESPWNYIRGLLEQCPSRESIATRSKISAFCSDLRGTTEPAKSNHLLATLIDLETLAMEENTEETEKRLEKAVEMCHTLSTKVDVIRKEYWEFIARDLLNRFG